MSSLEDDSISGSIGEYGRKLHDDEINKMLLADTLRNKKRMSLRDRIIDYVLNHIKATKGEVFIHVSSSGTCQTLMTSLVTTGILLEHKFDCGSCVYYSVNAEKVNMA